MHAVMLHPPSSLPSREILVVDDDAAVRDALCDVLEDEGFRVCTASNGQEALLQLSSRDHLPDAIVLDLTMPVMDGHEFLARRSTQPELLAIPVVVVTASLPSSLNPDVTLVRKPIDIEALIRAVRAKLPKS